MDERLHIANRVTIKPNYLVVTKILEGFGGRRSAAQEKTRENLADNTHKGVLSQQSIKKVKSAVNWLYASSKRKQVYSKRDGRTFDFKVNFITLTIPPQKESFVSSKELQSALNAFLVYSRKYFYLSNYVWKVETHKDKRLHLHIMTDTFIHHRELRRVWNQIAQKRGWLDEHFRKFNNYNPNSTDVHSVWKVRNIAAYIAKYMSKEGYIIEGFKGRMWGCSYALSAQHKCFVEVEPHYSSPNTSCLTNTKIKWKPIKSKPDAFGVTRTIADLFLIDLSQWKDYIFGSIKEKFVQQIQNIRDGMKQIPIDYLTVENLYSPKKQLIPCVTKTNTRKIGTIQYDLGF